MPEKIKAAMHPELIVGGLLVAVGAAAFLGESNAAMAAAIFKLWPAGLIGLGVALLIRTGDRT
jgi:hypothetical protein